MNCCPAVCEAEDDDDGARYFDSASFDTNFERFRHLGGKPPKKNHVLHGGSMVQAHSLELLSYLYYFACA